MADGPGIVPPSGGRIAMATVGALIVAGIILVTIVWPAEYGLDPTGVGSALGIESVSNPTRTVEIVDTLGGNETVLEAEIPAFGEPIPLPNPDVFQEKDADAETVTLDVDLPVDGETEIKALLETNNVILYSWRTDGGLVYSDFHGHSPDMGEGFVRYVEHQEGTTADSGSLVAPFAGEHGWYWLNLSDRPVKITLTIAGYFDDIIDYGQL